MATTLDNVVLVFTARGIQRTAKGINEVGFSAGRSAGFVRGLTGAIGALGGALAVRQVIAYADSFTELQNRLRLVSDSSEQVTFATQAIFDVASRTRASIEETGRTYFRFARANERLGLSEKELLDITETVNQAVAFSGTSAESASSALFQFSQGIAAGTLRGQELNSVLEQIPGLAEVLARGLGVGVDQLRKMGEQGRLTGKALAEALLSQREFAGEQFGRVIFTVSQEFEGLRTEIIRYVGEIDQALGASRALAKGIRFLALNVDLLGKSLLVIGGLIVRSFGPAAIRAVVGFGLALAANPIGAFITILGTAISVLTVFREEITIAGTEGVTVATALEVGWMKFKEVFGTVVDFAKTKFNEFVQGFNGAEVNTVLGTLGKNIGANFDAILTTLRDWANIAIGLITLPLRLFINNLTLLPAAAGDAFFRILETIRQVIVGQFDWEGFVTGLATFFIEAFKTAFDFLLRGAQAAFNAIKNLDFELPDIPLPDFSALFELEPIENEFDGALERFSEGFVKVITDTVNRDFIGEAGAVLQKLKTEVIDPFVSELNRAQAAKDALDTGETPRRAASTERPDIGPQTTATLEQIKEIESLTNRFQATTDKLRDGLDLLREFRDEVALFGEETFGVTVDEVDAAITELERRISGTTDLTKELFIGAAEAARSALVDILIDPLNASFKDLARGFVQTMQRIVAEAIAAEAVLAALNFLQGFTSFRIPGATATPRVAGSALGGDIIGGQARLVGERGPEVIVPSQRSRVIPNNQLGGNSAKDMKQLQSQVALLAKSIANMPAPTLVNVNEQDPSALLKTLNTQQGAAVQRNFVSTENRVIKRTLGVR
jgi:tape measure domain-containing protein